MSSVARPWHASYPDYLPHDIATEFDSVAAAFAATVQRSPDATAIRYFDGQLSFRELDERSDALAIALQQLGFATGDRLALYLQNNPAFVVGMLAAWKAGGIGVAVNPMNLERELSFVLEDSAATVLLCLDELYARVAKSVIERSRGSVRAVITCSALDDQSRSDARLFPPQAKRDAVYADGEHHSVLDLRDVLESFRGRSPKAVTASPEETAMLVYTSGTTGQPKGSMSSHRNMSFTAQVYRDWMPLTPADSILGIAPLFHITGIIGHVSAGLLIGCPLLLAHRFEPRVVMDLIREHRPTYVVAAITALMALSQVPETGPDDWTSFRAVYTGGAPVAPAIAEAFEASTGQYPHNAYGLTETNSPAHCVPRGQRAPVDEGSGALSVGIPVFSTVTRILDDHGTELPAGEVGEIAVAGPQVVRGYWQNPAASTESIPGGELRTGDVGFIDEDGWLFIVDRKKDMINVSGYKVWPREVEDVLYRHPAVREVAVIGVPDEYRGESVKAFVSVKAGASVDPAELIEFARQNMAAYKYPRVVEVIDELPKTVTGKILRRVLRDWRGAQPLPG
ncbi:class I adenylate-forming enzyme family protein [Leucobacter komagatae]|uniref:Acyl-CoA synthetase n=1 Tax=Leucobacter komagatae TaxID=55969 RepID=A0A0D0IJT1_9MICO|nr:AMP-binding protein [Leucobacter komagatae]KIP51317.1 acyl-CoA synthetase [Leucobacter komagatae]